MTLRLRESGAPDAEHVTLTSWHEGALSFLSISASPPGARVSLEIDGRTVPGFRLKVHRCRRGQDGIFLVDGRTFDLRRETRAALDSLSPARTLP